ncbi:3'-5' exonuclease [Spongiibacter tropicus]|uniref:3'-5' exonuclease n=1 Tax=Spongiibacter tropicus TaxID=454602 RepID=UPI0035BE5B1B
MKTTAFDLQINPANPGLSFHKLDRAKDTNFWSVRVSRDIRVIVHRTASSLLLCYVDHHDNAYKWAERRKLETHPKTGAAQIVELRESVREIEVPVYVEVEQEAPPKPALFANVEDDELLSYGVPREWLADVRSATEDSLLELADHLPAEASEALLELATGGTPDKPSVATEQDDPFAHPDAQRRFRVMTNVEELERALEYPWEKWTTFLHPAQRQWAEKDYSGPARISGSAGTGKTIVALHRAVYLARTNPESRVLLTTFSGTLASALATKLRRLTSNEPQLAERLEVHAIDAIGRKLHAAHFSKQSVASNEQLAEILRSCIGTSELPHPERFIMEEWKQVVDAWHLTTWEEYRDVRRLGRKTRLPEAQRAKLWTVFEKVSAELVSRSLITQSALLHQLAEKLSQVDNKPFDFAIVDEAQDIGVAELKFLAALAGNTPNGLFFAGDLGQRIFQQPFSWSALGVEIRGRSRALRINYRTSHQIRSQADRLLSGEVSDVDGNIEVRAGTVSVFNGPAPKVSILDDSETEVEAVSNWLQQLISEGALPHEIGIFVRSTGELHRATSAANAAGLKHKILDDTVDTTSNHISISTMHRAKGLEFKAVVVMACDDEIIPLQDRIETVVDSSDLEEVYETERHLLYVACTRARDQLLVTGVDPASEFLDDLTVG